METSTCIYCGGEIVHVKATPTYDLPETWIHMEAPDGEG